MELYPFQLDVNRQAWRSYQQGIDSVLLQIATGGGKTLCSSHLIKMRYEHMREKTLFLAHRRELVQQSARKLELAGMTPEIIMAGHAPNPWSNVMVGSIQTLLARRSWNGLPDAQFIVADECFPAGTMIGNRPIEDIKVGDSVMCLDIESGAAQMRRVISTSSRPVKRLLRLSFSDNSKLICTENHPLWNGEKWVASKDCLHHTIAKEYDANVYRDMRSVRNGVPEEIHEPNSQPVLQRCLQGEIQREISNEKRSLPKLRKGSGLRRRQSLVSGLEGEVLLRRGVQANSPRKKQGEGITGVEYKEFFCANEGGKPNVESRSSSESVAFSSEGRSSSKTSGRQRKTDERTPENISRGIGMADGSRGMYWEERTLPNILQDRYSKSGIEDRCRSGWEFALRFGAEGTGPAQGRIFAGARVDSIEVLEQGSDGEFERVCPDGYVYNFGVEKHHNYFANGFLVHNCHLSMAKGTLDILNHYREKGAKILGLTATPMRQDGKGLASVYRHMVKGPSVPWLMEHGYLVPRIEYRVGIAPDVSKVKINGGEYNQAQLEEASDRGILIGDIVENWLIHSANLRTLCFASGVKHSMHIVDKFREAGVSAAHIDGTTPKEERDAIYEKSQSGEVMVVSNAMVYIEGTDFPWMECLIDAQKNAGIVRYLQKGGRVMRSAEGKGFARYHDHAGNVYRHGRLELERDWELTEGKEQVEKLEEQRKKTDKVQVKCPKCGFILTAAVCTHCGHQWKTEGEEKEFLPAVLVEMTWDQLEQANPKKKAAKREYTKSELQEWFSGLLWIAKERGKYKNPEGIAAFRYKEKFKEWPKGLRRVAAQPSLEVEAWDRHSRQSYARRASYAKSKEKASA